MTKGAKAWDDIPSLENLEVDWNYKPQNPLGKRAYVRLTAKELQALFGKNQILVNIATEIDQFKAVLRDLSQGGISISINEKLKCGQIIKLGFFLGKERIISRGSVRNLRRNQTNYIVGIEFLGLDREKSRFIASLYPSLKIRD